MFYFLLFAVTTILFYLAQICGKRWSGGYYLLSFLGVFMLAFVAGCRDNSIGTDIHVYGLKTFNVARGTDSFWEGYEIVKGYSELGYYLINYLSVLLSSKYGLVLFLQSFILYILVCCGVRNIAGSQNLAVGMLVFNLYYYSMTLNLMRQCVAIAFVMWSFRFFMERKPFKLLLCAIICFFLHKSSVVAFLVFFIAYWITNLDYRKQRIVIIVCALSSIGGILLFGELLSMVAEAIPIFSKFNAYGVNSRFTALLSKIDIFVRAGMLVTTVLLVHFRKCDEKKGLLLSFFLIVDLATQFLGIYAYFATRIGYYFFAINIPMLLNVLLNSKLTRGTKTVSLACLIAYFSIYCIKIYIIGGANETYPYQSEILS